MLKDRLTKVFDDNLIDHITYKQWIAVDRSTLETISKPSDEFVETICEKVEILLSHILLQNSRPHSTMNASLH